MVPVFTAQELIPTVEDFEKVISAKFSYNTAENKFKKGTAAMKTWESKHFMQCPWGVSYSACIAKYKKAVEYAQTHNKPIPSKNSKILLSLHYFIIAVVLDWPDLIQELKRTLKNWGYTTNDLQQIAQQVWQDSKNIDQITKNLIQAQNGNNIKLVEAIEKHLTLNPKLFTKEEKLKSIVRNKLLEIVDEFLADLKEQDIKIKIDDILLIGSNASYNYTKNSDIDLHIVANAKAVKYDPEVSDALYGAYRTLFNKQLDIKLFDIPVEIFVETENSPRKSNGIYSVKNNKWVKKPVSEDIPEYDKQALNNLIAKWENKCKTLINDIEANKLNDEKKVVKLLEDIYENLRKKGIAKSEYSIENLAFKELRNKGYLDKLKDSRNDLVSKRLSLEERLNNKYKQDIYNQITRIAGSPPIIQNNGMFYLYNLKSSDVHSIVLSLRKLSCIKEVSAYDNGKYDFSDTLHIAMHKIPNKYYNITGQLVDNE